VAKEPKEKKRFEGMTLSGWQVFSNMLLGKLLRKKARADIEMQKTLLQADIRIMPEVYKATTIMSTVVAFAICVGALALAFAPEFGGIALYEKQQTEETIIPCIDWAFWNPNDINAGLDWTGVGPDEETYTYGGCPFYETKVLSGTARAGLVFFFGILAPIFAYRHFLGAATRKKTERGEALEKYLPYAASYTAAMAAANATPAKIFRSLAVNEEIYGEISYDSAMIYRDITLLGMDLVTAIKLSVDRAASPWVSQFFQGMTGTLTSGGNLKIYFLNRAEHYMRENRIRLSIFLESLAMLAESYVVVAVAMPLFLIVMLVIMFWVSGSGAQLSETMVYGVVVGVLPTIHIAYAILVWMMSKEQEM
jgi:hypothetical protein